MTLENQTTITEARLLVDTIKHLSVDDPLRKAVEDFHVMIVDGVMSDTKEDARRQIGRLRIALRTGRFTSPQGVIFEQMFLATEQLVRKSESSSLASELQEIAQAAADIRRRVAA